jgi:quercetin dioxygenase-like cupin family protein
MPQTIFIDTTVLPRTRAASGGEYVEILNEALVGARNVRGTLRWVPSGGRFEVDACPQHQLVYVMRGAGTIELTGTRHAVTTGAGVYLAPLEQAAVQAGPEGPIQLFHLVVPKAAEGPPFT